MAVSRADVLGILLVLIFLIYNLAYFSSENEPTISLNSNDNYNHLAVTLIKEKLRNVDLKVPKFTRKCFVFMLLMLCGDIESCPGPTGPTDGLADMLRTKGMNI